ncbi:unnamed protein product [Darwinula stevensoni]|uniref:Uncharacterized protein n=1 Tax=Darwinula stevensoni TaxID=69355 RepID=A0A7R8XM22_9CRUS|nr:unnamed protein product [Darwinula stevensoni]CAG0895013.1 unnamed protein product [Darwinula stevensoni]
MREFRLNNNEAVNELAFSSDDFLQSIFVQKTIVRRILLLRRPLKLKQLNVWNSQLEEFDFEVLPHLINLRLLDLHGNTLTRVPHSASMSLEELHLYDNKITTFEEKLSMPNLKNLNIGKNPISKLPTAFFEDLVSLEKFWCAFCNMGPVLSEGYLKFHSPALRQVGLFFNNISKLERGAIIGNSIYCDCNIAWLVAELALRNAVTEGYCQDGTDIQILDIEVFRRRCHLCPRKCIELDMAPAYCARKTIIKSEHDDCSPGELCCETKIQNAGRKERRKEEAEYLRMINDLEKQIEENQDRYYELTMNVTIIAKDLEYSATNDGRKKEAEYLRMINDLEKQIEENQDRYYELTMKVTIIAKDLESSATNDGRKMEAAYLWRINYLKEQIQENHHHMYEMKMLVEEIREYWESSATNDGRKKEAEYLRKINDLKKQMHENHHQMYEMKMLVEEIREYWESLATNGRKMEAAYLWRINYLKEQIQENHHHMYEMKMLVEEIREYWESSATNDGREKEAEYLRKINDLKKQMHENHHQMYEMKMFVEEIREYWESLATNGGNLTFHVDLET